jgi:antitoxin FitA
MKNITLRLDDEIYRQARIRAAEQDSSVSAHVKRLLLADIKAVAIGPPSPAILELAAELRVLTAGRSHTPAEILQREGRDGD